MAYICAIFKKNKYSKSSTNNQNLVDYLWKGGNISRFSDAKEEYNR